MYLSDFSQGAIISYSIDLSRPEPLKGVVALSGRILKEISPSIHPTEGLSQLKIMVAHGIADGTLPISYAREAKEYLQQLKVNLSYKEYPIGHHINEHVIADLVHFL